MESKKKRPLKLSRQLLIDALVYNCHSYEGDGFCSHCSQGGVRSNCVKENCSRVGDIFRTMQEIADGKISVL